MNFALASFNKAVQPRLRRGLMLIAGWFVIRFDCHPE
jgi:hypothetical protein